MGAEAYLTTRGPPLQGVPNQQEPDELLLLSSDLTRGPLGLVAALVTAAMLRNPSPFPNPIAPPCGALFAFSSIDS